MKLILCTLMSLYSSQLLLTVNSIPQLDSGPVDARVKVGSDATFECSVSDVSPYILYWRDRKHNIFITLGNHVFDETKYSIISGSYGLKILNVKPTDAGEYECNFSDNVRYYQFTPPAKATLTVLQPPSANSPKCALIKDNNLVAAETPFYVGETIELFCSSQGHGNTQPRLDIMVSSFDVAEYTRSEVIDKKEVLSRYIITENTEIELQCYLDSEALDELKVCKIRPIVLTPTVMLQPTTLSAFESTSVSFRCSGNNFKTTNLQYEWQVSPYVPGQVISFRSPALNIALNTFKFQSSSFVITCFVRHGNIVRNASSYLSIMRDTTLSVDTSKTNRKIDNINNDNFEYTVTLPLWGIIITIVITVAVIAFIGFRFCQKLYRNRMSKNNSNATIPDMDRPKANGEIENRNITFDVRADSVYYSTIGSENVVEYVNCNRGGHKKNYHVYETSIEEEQSY